MEENQPSTSSQPVSDSSRPSKRPRTPSSSLPSELSQRIAKSEEMLRTLVERAAGPSSHSKREGFANYVYKALLRMPARQYRELKPLLFEGINACLGDSEDEDDSVPLPSESAEEEATGDDLCGPSKRQRSQWQPHPSQWHPHPPQGTSVHGSMDAGYMARYWSAFSSQSHTAVIHVQPIPGWQHAAVVSSTADDDLDKFHQANTQALYISVTPPPVPTTLSSSGLPGVGQRPGSHPGYELTQPQWTQWAQPQLIHPPGRLAGRYCC